MALVHPVDVRPEEKGGSALMRVLKAFAAVVVLVVLVVGVPALLLAWSNPLALLDVQWSTALFRPDDGTILLGVLSLAGWAAWLVLTFTTAVEVISHVSRRRWRVRLPGVNWLQPLVGGLVAMALTPLLSSQADEFPPPTAAHAPLTVVAEAQDPNPGRAPDTGVSHYVVQPGDELWGIAERQLGSGTAWRTVVDCNPGMTADTALTPGKTILLPASAAPSPSAAPGVVDRITVRDGDTLWDLAQEHLGDPRMWPELFDANRERIVDPDEIDVGWQLSIPTPPPEQSEVLPPPEQEPAPAQVEPIPPQPHTAPPTTGATTPGTTTTSPSEVTDVQVPPPAKPRSAGPARTAHPVEGSRSPADSQQAADPDSSVDLLGPVGGLLAASLVAGVVARRRIQLLHRGIGRRISILSPHLQRFFSALVQRSNEVSGGQPDLQPTSVVVGWDDDGETHIDVERQRCTLLQGSDEHTAAMAATTLTSLLSAQWSTDVEVVVVQAHDNWTSALDDPRLSSDTSLDDGLAHLQRTCAQRRLQLGHSDLATVRADEDLAGAWTPRVFIFCQPVHPGHVDRIRDCLALGEVGVSVVAAASSVTTDRDWATVLVIQSENSAHLDGTDEFFQPQLLNEPARHAVMSLFTTSLDERTEPAPWWRDDDSLPKPTATILPKQAEEPIKDDAMPAWSPNPPSPTLLLLGPVELLGPRGTPPTRAVGQCMEYCAWLLMNPGATPTSMVRELLVAEGTRRSNMSRLRSWLGNDTDDKPYLPDAYSGHIALSSAVTSDWEQFQSLLAGGVNQSSTALLWEALSLVRGRPLEGVTFQWPWVSQWLSDMLSMITDAATVLADRCLTDGDVQGALWAIAQGHLATGDDETLAVRRIHALAIAGDRPAVETAITQLTRAARAESRDLKPESIRRIQHALHTAMPTNAQRWPRPNIAIRDSEDRPVG